jgi:Ni/Co efflux regulator RcnB
MRRNLKRFLCGTMAIALMVPGLATAQTRERPGTTRPARPQHQRPTKPQQHRPTRPSRPTRPAPQRPSPTRPRPPHGNRPVIQPVRPGHGNRPVIQPVRPGHGNRPIVRPTRPIHRPGYRPAHVRRIHVSVFHYPRGYRYHRWVIGRVLPHLFLSHQYYYDNWYDLGFGPPPHGYRWVRYGPDLLLVNLHNGRIVDVVYGVFY